MTLGICSIFFFWKRSYPSWFFLWLMWHFKSWWEAAESRSDLTVCSVMIFNLPPWKRTWTHLPSRPWDYTACTPTIVLFEASTLSLLAILFSLSHIATIRKNIPARLFPLNVNLLTSGLYETLHTLSFISVWQLQSQREFLYLSTIFHFSLFHRPSLLYVATCKLHHILLPSTTFFCIRFRIYKILA